MRNIEHDCILVEKKILNSENVFLTFESSEIAKHAQPGQFINIKGSGFLRRPFGIALVDQTKERFSIGIKKKAAGTASFFKAEVGTVYSILGPLGHSFSFDSLQKIFLIGGGTGIYPLLFVLKKARELDIKTYIATGFRSKQDILLDTEMRAMATELYIATEDGSAYIEGYAQDALEQLWADFGVSSHTNGGFTNNSLTETYLKSDKSIIEDRSTNKHTSLFCCGPQPMMQKAANWAETIGLPCQVSMEERMACGFGICRTCAVAVTGQYRAEGENENEIDREKTHYDRCCIEGPVFPAEVIKW